MEFNGKLPSQVDRIFYWDRLKESPELREYGDIYVEIKGDKVFVDISLNRKFSYGHIHGDRMVRVGWFAVSREVSDKCLLYNAHKKFIVSVYVDKNTADINELCAAVYDAEVAISKLNGKYRLK